MFSFFRFNKSLPINFIIKPVGVTTIKKTKPITNGETIFPKNIPNLNHNLFKGVNNFELFKPKIKKIKEINNAQILISLEVNNYNEIIKKIEKTIQKFYLLEV